MSAYVSVASRTKPREVQYTGGEADDVIKHGKLIRGDDNELYRTMMVVMNRDSVKTA